MAYYSGTATSASDLITAVINAATPNGWSNPAGSILSKGNVYVELSQWRPYATSGVYGVGVQAGTGQSGGSLTTPCPSVCGIRSDYAMDVLHSQGGPSLSYACNYHIFINTIPDDIILAVNYNSVWWQYLGFGQASIISNLTGTGIHCWGTSVVPQNDGYDQLYFNMYTGGYPCFYNRLPGYVTNAGEGSSYIHLSLDYDATSYAWWANADANSADNSVRSYDSVREILLMQPNDWNNEALLIRSQILANQPSGFQAYVAELPHIRWLRNTYIGDGTVVTLGSDNWFVSPVTSRDVATPEGADGYSGTVAFAIKKVI